MCAINREVCFMIDKERDGGRYVCQRCHAVFDEPAVVSDNPTHLCGVLERWQACPDCDFTHFNRERRCAICSATLECNPDKCDFELCDDCKRAALDFFRLLLGKWFSREELMYLSQVYGANDLCDGVSFWDK